MTGANGRASVLVIDDDDDIRELLSDYLVAHGYAVRVAADAASGLARIGERAPEIVLIDVDMPGLTGVDALPQIVALAPHAAVIMVSGAADTEVATRTRALGAMGYVMKPFDFSVLSETVAIALADKRSNVARGR